MVGTRDGGKGPPVRGVIMLTFIGMLVIAKILLWSIVNGVIACFSLLAACCGIRVRY